jgi:hypothetical protein
MAPAYRAGRAIHLGTARPLAHQWSVVYGRPAQAFLQKDGNGKISPAPLKTDALSSLPMKSTLIAVEKAASTSSHAPSSPIRSFRVAPCMTGSA